MNKFQLRLSPETELHYMVTIASGLASNPRLVTYEPHAVADPAEQLPGLAHLNGADKLQGAALVAQVAFQVFNELRTRVESSVDNHPERYTGLSADQMPTE